MLVVALVAAIQPFKLPSHNKITILSLHLLTLIPIITTSIKMTMLIAPKYYYFFYVCAFILGAVPLFYFIFSSSYWIYSKRRFGIETVLRLKAWRRGYSYDSLPDRIENSGEYPRENLANFTSQQFYSGCTSS